MLFSYFTHAPGSYFTHAPYSYNPTLPARTYPTLLPRNIFNKKINKVIRGRFATEAGGSTSYLINFYVIWHNNVFPYREALSALRTQAHTRQFDIYAVISIYQYYKSCVLLRGELSDNIVGHGHIQPPVAQMPDRNAHQSQSVIFLRKSQSLRLCEVFTT